MRLWRNFIGWRSRDRLVIVEVLVKDEFAVAKEAV